MWCAGGVKDQPARYVLAMQIIDGRRANAARERLEKRRKKNGRR